MGGSRLSALAGIVLALFAVNTSAAQAIPAFAHRYGFTCQVCHTVVPHLNPFGQTFLKHGYRIQGLKPKDVFPLAARANIAYSSEPNPSGLPKAIVDEVELFFAGSTGPHVSYFFEQYLVDGGVSGATRDAWVGYRPQPFASSPLVLTAGQFTLPLPVDPETFRDSALHYAVFDQTVGKNPFNFFDDKIGASIAYGDSTRGLSGTFAALQGHDKQSGLRSDGVDTMLEVQHTAGPATFSLYRYDGSRSLGVIPDRFWRQGYGFSLTEGRATLDLVLQEGNDSSFKGFGTPASSSGGFAQLRYEMTNATYAIFRLDGTDDPTNGFTQTGVVLFGCRFSHNTRFTIEDDLSHAERAHNALQAQLTVAY